MPWAKGPNLASALARSRDWFSGGGDEVGLEPGVAQPLLEAQLRARLVGRQRLEQPPPLARRQPAQQGEVHGRHSGPWQRGPSAVGERLALELTEC